MNLLALATTNKMFSWPLTFCRRSIFSGITSISPPLIYSNSNFEQAIGIISYFENCQEILKSIFPKYKCFDLMMFVASNVQKGIHYFSW